MEQQTVKKHSMLAKAFTAMLVAFMWITLPSAAQNVVRGIVTDAAGDFLPGVSVQVSGSTKVGSVTDINGAYSIKASGKDILVFSYVGMKQQKVKVGGRNLVNVTMQEDASTLTDVVVVGYGSVKKQSLTGAVSAMRGDELLKGPSTNISSVLGGKLPGLSSVQVSGEPGDDQASLRIRGSQYAPLYIVDGMPRSINDIDPNDIESVSVLKDGSAAAVYGLNAAGGVIIVTTKNGQKGKPKVSYDGQYGISVNANFPKFMNGPEYAYYYNMADYMDKLANGTVKNREEYTPVFTKANIEAMLNGDPTDGWDNVDYIDKVFGTGSNMKHNVSLQGGNEDVSYYVAAGFMNQKGNIDNFDYRRYNLRANITAKVSRDWTIKLGTVGTVTRKHTPGYASGGADDGSGGSGEVGWLSIGHQAIMMRPYLPETWNGQYTATIPNNASVAYSPLAGIYDSGYKKTRGADINTNLSIEYAAPWLPGLKLKATGSYDYLSSKNKNLNTPYQTYSKDLSTGSFVLLEDPRDVSSNLNHVADGQYTTEQLVGQFSIEFARKFGKHNVDAMLLVEGRDYKSSSMAAYAYKVPFAELPEISLGTATKENPVSGYSSHSRTAGYVFRMKYDYADTYLAEFSGRYDGSYKFSGNVAGKRWGFFPSFSAGWRVSNETFMENAHSWLSDFKLRASIGLLGNDNVSAFSYLSTYSFGANRVIGGNIVSSLYTSGIANPNLSWAKTRSTNAGFDATLWDGLLGLSFDWFYNLNYDILTYMGGDKAPSMGGYYSTYENYNRYSNYGLEWTLSHRNKFNVGGKPFHYSASLNMTWATSKWLRYPDDPNTQSWRKVVGTDVDATYIWIAEGLYRSEEEITNSAWYGTRPNLGDIKYKDLNGDGVIDEQDRGRFGRSNRPKIMAGLNLSANWNGFDFNAQFTGGFKFDVSLLGTYYNGYDDNTVWSQTFKEGANSPLWLVQNSYSEENTDAMYPRITLSTVSHGGNNGLASSFWNKKGDYIRLKTIQLGYSLPKAWTQAIGIETIRIYAEASNLFTIDSLPAGVDPESPRVNNGYYPQQRTFMGGINITF